MTWSDRAGLSTACSGGRLRTARGQSVLILVVCFAAAGAGGIGHDTFHRPPGLPIMISAKAHGLGVVERTMNIYALCAVEAGLDTISLVANSTPIKGVIGLAETSTTGNVAGYANAEAFCLQRGILYRSVASYSLIHDDDRRMLEGLDIDVLLIAGWQRLVPDWLIEHCRIGAVGVHGSALGITRGRGRSPQNWALILGKKQFEISIFFVEKGVDCGSVIDTRIFPLLEHDDIRTSYYKASWCVADMFVEAIHSGRLSRGTAQPQIHEDARYLPQRRPEDGAIDWSRSTKQVCDFVRALTRPYPGAYCSLGNNELHIWVALPFDTGATPSDRTPGEISAILTHGELIIRTGDGYLLVSDYTLQGGGDGALPRHGEVLSSTPFPEQLRRVLDRHRAKYPTLKLSEELEELAAP